MSTAILKPEIASQIDALELDAARPLIVTDADEVLFQFMAGLERFLDSRGYVISLDSFAITGNVRHVESGNVVQPDEMKDLLGAFFEAETHRLDPVAGAADALAELAGHADIVVLSNVPLPQREMRAQALAANGMPYPLVANAGLKGDAVAALAARSGRPLFFLDDIPHNLQSVHDAVADVHLIHFVADERLRRLVPSPKAPHVASGEWEHTLGLITERIAAHANGG